jgi:ATP-binding cassette subfamily C exporter for protease/lipase
MSAKPNAFPELQHALLQMRRYFMATAAFSLLINFLLLVPTLYMLQVYDRVLTSRSETTLIVLTLVMLAAYALLSAFEWIRARLLIRAGITLDEHLSSRVFSSAFEANLQKASSNPAQALQDLLTIRQFLTGNGLFAFFDMPWAPIYLVVIFIMHPLLGWFSLVGAVTLLFLTWITELATKRPLAAANTAALQSMNYANNHLVNAEVIAAMGMLPNLERRWREVHRNHLLLQGLASDRASVIGGITKFVRLSMQSLILGFGAYLAIRGEISPGGMIASSILMGRALAPVELLIGTWKSLITTRGAYERLGSLLNRFPVRRDRMSLPGPRGEFRVEGLVAVPPGAAAPVLKGINFSVAAGEIVGVIGPSASGKSTLARMLVGIWPPHSGKVRLDGSDVYEWNKVELGPNLGYLPQDIELFDGNIAENIARFGEVDAEKVIAAASRAGVHDMVLRFPFGYDTPIGPGGGVLSGGQRQRIGLARALYGDPSVIILDEPNSNLDDVGEAALVKAVFELKTMGRTVIVITHRMNIIRAVDRLLVLQEGRVQAYGPRRAVLQVLEKSRREVADTEAMAQARSDRPITTTPAGVSAAMPSDDLSTKRL